MVEEKVEEKVVFSWMDEEEELLLSIVSDYKMEMAVERINWETCKERYEELVTRFVSKYTKETENFPTVQTTLPKTGSKES